MKLGKQRENAFYKWEVLILLWFAFWFNQADRQLYNTLLEKISDSLSMTSAEAGLVATVFCWVLAICFPLAGFAAERRHKLRIHHRKRNQKTDDDGCRRRRDR